MIKDKLQKDGYAVVSLFSEEDLASLTSLYRKHHLNFPQGDFFATMFHPDLGVKLEVSRGIANVLESCAAEILPKYNCLFANFLVKAPHSTYAVGIHQDWTYIDEHAQSSFNIWSSLEPTEQENGGLFVLPKSHKFKNPYRGTPFNGDLYNKNEQSIRENSILVPTKLGEAIIYDSRLIHYSLPNQSDRPRVAFAGIMTPKASDPLHYFQRDGRLLKYQADEKFFCTLVPDEEPHQACIEEIVEWYRPNSSDLSNFILSLDKNES